MSGRPFTYAEPITGVDPKDCFFYHRMDLPGVGQVGGQWELRAVAKSYLGKVDFRGKRVLDVGAASGFLTFEMEKRGAEVVSFDMVSGRSWNIVPQAVNQRQREQILDAKEACHASLKNAYWFTHEKLNSSAKAYYGDVYHLPLELGRFDIVFFGMILGHLRDPFQALYSASRLTDGQIIITNQAEKPTRKRKPIATFMPSRENEVIDCWWALSPECLTQMLEVIGFEVDVVHESWPKCLVEGRIGKERCQSLVAHRVSGAAECVDDASVQRSTAAA